MIRFIMLLLPLCLSACLPNSPLALKESAEEVVKFTSPHTYQETYRRIIEPARRCWQGGAFLTGGFMVQSDLYTDTRRAEITLLQQGLAQGAVFSVDIAALDKGGADVTVYVWAAKRAFAPQVKAWALTSFRECGMPDA